MVSTTSLHESDPPKAVRNKRKFFTGLGLSFIAIAALGFGPHIRAFLGGSLAIPAFAHVHGAIMASWLLVFVFQALFARRGQMNFHRRLGSVALWLGVVVWLSLIAITLRDFSTQPYPLNENIYYSLPQLYIIVVFAPLLVGAWRTRSQPQWHKRLITVATISLLQAAVDRFEWLPFHPPIYWPQVVCLDILLVPLAAYDLATQKRVHPATVAAGAWLVAVQALTLVVWQSVWWQSASVSLARFYSAQ